jgi:hypothetical protein
LWKEWFVFENEEKNRAELDLPENLYDLKPNPYCLAE